MIDHDAARLDGAEEAGGVLLSAHESRLLAEDIHAYLARARAQGAAALHHLRQRRRRQEHADRAAAATSRRCSSRTSSARARGRLEAGRHAGRATSTSRCSLDGLVGRARAGHHDRRRLPLLRDRPAQVHRRRHARPRAVHAQHGHRRLDRRLRRDPRSTRARACSRRRGATPPSSRCSASGTSCVAVNKMDLVDYAEERFREHRGRVRASCAAEIGVEDVRCIPISALTGDNVVAPERRAAAGTTGRRCSSTSRRSRSTTSGCRHSPFRLPGAVGEPAEPRLPRLRRDDRRRAFVAPGDRGRRAARRGGRARSSGSSPATATSDVAVAGQSVTLTLADEIDISRGDVIAHGRRAGRGRRPVRGDDRLDGRRARCCRAASYLHAHRRGRPPSPRSTPLKHKVDVDTLEHLAATKLELNEIGVCAIELDRPIAFDPYAENRDTGGFILIDRHHATRRSAPA